VARARAFAVTKAGAIALSRTGDPNIGEFADAVVLFKAGEVPEDVFGGRLVSLRHQDIPFFASLTHDRRAT
jgi:hypothetical protein